jgi:ABC-type branched-subunit amino acid transport system ATPase component
MTATLELASRAFVMDGGRITRSGTSDELHEDPAVREAYLGSL